ncbi:MAG: hypothetical protein IPK50_15765 [Fibrobacterota bacterium]|nr:MAG: hypothetical protein IPK50_15765 [Fibrobacterota bacterium]
MNTSQRASLRAIALALSAATGVAAAVPGKLSTDWVGNTFGYGEMIDPKGAATDGMNRMWVQNYIANTWVSRDGKVFTCSNWDEGSRAAGIYKDGKVLGQLVYGKDLFGFSGDIVGDDKYVYATTGVDWGNWERHGYGIQRFTHTGQTAGWTGGRGFQSSYLVVRDSGWNPTIARLAIDTAAQELYLYDSLTDGGSVLVFDLATMSQTPKATWKVSAVEDMVGDQAGNLWILRNHKVQKFTNRGVATSVEVASLLAPTRIAMDAKKRLMVFDDSTLQIHVFGGLDATPVEATAFGAKGGIYSGIKGKIAPDKLLPKCAGLGADSAGNIYMAWGGVAPVAGSDIRGYNPDFSLKWQLIGHTFVACGGFDPGSDGQDIYYRDHHYTVDYSKPTGKKWNYESFLWDRATDTPSVFGGSVLVRRLGGKTILASTASDQMSGGFRFYRMDQQVAVPAGILADGSWAWWIELDGDVWNVDGSGKVKRFAFKGLDGSGNPSYDKSRPEVFPSPADLDGIQRVHYDPVEDAIYFTGYDDQHIRPNEWGRTGSVFAKYEGWTAGARKLAWKIALPLDNRDANIGDATLKDMSIAGDYAFFVTCNSTPATTVYVYSLKDGSLVGTILPGPEIAGDISFMGSMGGLGWVDMAFGIQAFKRSNGEYQILVEDDVHAKNVWYHWCPTGNCPEGTSTTARKTQPAIDRSLKVDLRHGRVILPGGRDLGGRAAP